MDSQKYDSALRDLNRVLKLNPKLRKAYQYRGIIYDSMGRYEDALKEFDKYRWLY